MQICLSFFGFFDLEGIPKPINLYLSMGNVLASFVPAFILLLSVVYERAHL